MITEGRKAHPALALYLWLVAVTGARRGELCALQVCDVDLGNGVLHIAFNYVVVDGRRVRKDTKTYQDRYLAIDPVTCGMIREHLGMTRTDLAAVGLELPEDAYVFSNDPIGANPWNPDWASHKASDLATAAGVQAQHQRAAALHGQPTARGPVRPSQHRCAPRPRQRRRHHSPALCRPVSEVDRRAAAYLAQLTAGSGA